MSSEEDIFNDGVLNANPSPGGSMLSTPMEYSGVEGRAASPVVVGVAGLSGSSNAGYHCQTCGNVLKTKSGFTRHSMTHKLNEYESRQPEKQEMEEALPGFLKAVIQSIKHERAVGIQGSEKIKFCEAFTFETPECVEFTKAISEPIVSALLVKKRVMPSAQYENAVGEINAILSKSEFYETVREKLVVCVLQHQFSNQLLNRMIWRIASKLMEKIQTRIFHQMKLKHLAANETFSMNECDKLAFQQHICRILRCTFRFGVKSKNHIWKLRCDCLRMKFVAAPQEVKNEEFADSKLWTEDSSGICLSPVAFSLFLGLHRIIQTMHDTGAPTSEENVLNSLTHPDNIIILDEMRLLTQGKLSEDAAINFLKDLIKAVTDLSGKMEAGRKFSKASKKQATSAVSLRTNLKRNPSGAPAELAEPSLSSNTSDQEKAKERKRPKKNETTTPTKKLASLPKAAAKSSKPTKSKEPTPQPAKPKNIPSKPSSQPGASAEPKKTSKETPTTPTTRRSSRIRDLKQK